MVGSTSPAAHGQISGDFRARMDEALGHIADARLLPTPTSSDTNGAGAHGDGGLDLRTTVSLLPTPRAEERMQRNSRDDGVALSMAVTLLPTPTTTQRGTDANLDTREGARANLHNEVANLLPTPTSGDSVGVGYATEWAELTDANGRHRLRDAANLHVHHATWGDYGPAIARWEALTRPAPAPTEPGAKGAPRLSPRFVEWMMGLPEGWVDVEGVSRNEQLKALGNGVVPQQAAAATRAFLADMPMGAVA